MLMGEGATKNMGMRYADMEISSPEFYSMIDESADLASEK